MDVAEDILDEKLWLPVVRGQLDLITHHMLVPLIDSVKHVNRSVQSELRPDELHDVLRCI